MEFTYLKIRQLKKKKNGFQFFQISVLNLIPVSNLYLYTNIYLPKGI